MFAMIRNSMHRGGARAGSIGLLHLLIALSLVLVASVPAVGQTLGDCAVGSGFGSTLLVPYFETDLSNPSGLSTLVSINNGFSSETLVRVVVWTDWGVPTLAFDLYLPGFSLVNINMRDVFNGIVPSTGDGVDLSDFAFCNGSLAPIYSTPALTLDERSQVRADHRGLSGPLLPSSCAGQPLGDTVARGYITVDVVDECSGLEAVEPVFTPARTSGAFPYFVDGGSGAGIATISNRLWGDVAYVVPGDNAAQGVEAVAIWGNSAEFSGTGLFTFYGRYFGWDGRDDRVPLPDIWNSRFFNGGVFAGGASLIVYRDTTSAPETASCSPGSSPSWAPLNDTTVTRDELGGQRFQFPNNTNFPIATQRIDFSTFNVSYDFGRVQLLSDNLPSWMQSTLTASGLFSIAFNGSAVSDVCSTTPPAGPVPAQPDVSFVQEEDEAAALAKAAESAAGGPRTRIERQQPPVD